MKEAMKTQSRPSKPTNPEKHVLGLHRQLPYFAQSPGHGQSKLRARSQSDMLGRASLDDDFLRRGHEFPERVRQDMIDDSHPTNKTTIESQGAFGHSSLCRPSIRGAHSSH